MKYDDQNKSAWCSPIVEGGKSIGVHSLQHVYTSGRSPYAGATNF